MLTLLLFLLILASITVFPVMIAAKIVNAKNTGFAHALFALLLQAILSGLLHAFIHRPLVSAIGSLLLAPAIYAMVLKTTYLRGLVISVLFVVIAVIAIFLLGPLIGFHYMDMQSTYTDTVTT